MAESEMSTKTPRSGAGWKSGGTRGRADGSERAVLYLFLMFLLTRCRCLPISFLSHIFFLSFSCCSSWYPTAAGEPWKDWKPSGTSTTGRWVCGQWAAQGLVISQDAAAERGFVAAIRACTGQESCRADAAPALQSENLHRRPHPSRLPPACLSPFEREWRQCHRPVSTMKGQQPPPRRSRLRSSSCSTEKNRRRGATSRCHLQAPPASFAAHGHPRTSLTT
ncbi:hypothetical protein VPH35_127796 [Triticum aestivum]